MSDYFVYMLSNKSRMLYVGVTNNLERRLFEHREKFVPGFPERFGLTRLVYYEVTGSVEAAIYREKAIKGWVRRKKTALIHALNPEWKDLSTEWMPANPPPCHSEGAKRLNESQGGVKEIPIRPDILRCAQDDKGGALRVIMGKSPLIHPVSSTGQALCERGKHKPLPFVKGEREGFNQGLRG